jgi:hypothetical protein
MSHGARAKVESRQARRSGWLYAALVAGVLVCGGIAEALAEREPCILLKSTRKPMRAVGVGRVAVIIVDFPGVPTTYTPSAVVKALKERQPGSPFSAFDAFNQSSRGAYQLDFGTRSNGQPSVFGPYLVERSATERCSKRYSDWSKMAAALASTAGYKRKSYKHTVFLFPPRETIGCSVTGIGEVAGDTTWLFGLSPNSFIHEVGHNLGLFHSGRRDQTGIGGQYGDLSSPMGSFQPPTLLFSAPHQSQLGWLPAAEQETVRAGTLGRRTVYALERQRSATLARVISVPLADGSSYRLSYRQEFPEAPSSRSRAYVRGVTIHRDFGLGLTTRLIGILRDGESFIDEANNVSVTQVSHSADNVTFDLASASPPAGADKSCLLLDPCSVTAEERSPRALDCRGFVAPRNPLLTSTSGRCPTRAAGEDYDLDGVADTGVQTADADGDGIPNEEDCNPTSSALYRLYRYTDGDNDGAYESTLTPVHGVCGAVSIPSGFGDETPLDSCASVGDSSQTDNDHDGIGDVCQTADTVAASRRRILPSVQQLARSASTLSALKSGHATLPILGSATSKASQRFLTLFGSEPALSSATKAAIKKASAQIDKPGQQKVGARALADTLKPLL